jgi:hypothetical protein
MRRLSAATVWSHTLGTLIGVRWIIYLAIRFWPVTLALLVLAILGPILGLWSTGPHICTYRDPITLLPYQQACP